MKVSGGSDRRGDDGWFVDRRQVLDWMLILGRRHLERVMREWIAHYNRARPHRGLDLQTPIARSDPVVSVAAVHCCTRLGRLASRVFGPVNSGSSMVRSAHEFVCPQAVGVWPTQP